MILMWLFLKILVVNSTIISDLLRFKNIHQCVLINYDKQKEMKMHRILHRSKIRQSSVVFGNTTAALSYSNHRVGIILNAYENWDEAFNLDIEKSFQFPFSWIAMTDDLENTLKVFSTYPIFVDSDVTIVYNINNEYHLYEIYNTGTQYVRGKIIVRPVGYWNKTLTMRLKNRNDLNGIMLRSIILITKNQYVGHRSFEEYMEKTKPSLSFVDTTHKLKFYEVTKYFKDMYNVTYNFSRTNSWGYPTKTGFDGLVGALYRFEADIGGSPVFLRTDRWPAVDFVTQSWPARMTFVFRHPKHPGGVYTIYTRPLSNQVWYCIIVFLAISTVILQGMLRLKKIRTARDNTDDSIGFAFLFTLGALCQQGTEIHRNSTAIKITTFSIFLLTLTLYQYYNALVVSTLLQELPNNIRNMRDLLDSGLKAGVEDMLYTKDFFKRTTDPLALEMYRKRIDTGREYNYYPAEYGMALVKRGGYAFHIEAATAYRIAQNTFDNQEICESSEVRMHEPRLPTAVLPKGSPYREHIAYAIRVMKERGILHRLEKLWDASRPVCVHDAGSSLIAVSLNEFQTVLIILAVGYVMSLILLAFEVLDHAVKRSGLRCQRKELFKFHLFMKKTGN